MTASRSPSEQTLLDFATGRLSAAEALVVETHLAMSPPSRGWVARLEAVGGVLLDGLPPAVLANHSKARLLARLDSEPRHADPLPVRNPDLPAPLQGVELGPWKWAGAGTQFRRVLLPGDGKARAILLKIGAGRKMPQHTHAGNEFTCVISGHYWVGDQRFGPGDFEEADDEVSHQPVVDASGPFLCIASLEGGIRLEGRLGRLLQPFVRI